MCHFGLMESRQYLAAICLFLVARFEPESEKKQKPHGLCLATSLGKRESRSNETDTIGFTSRFIHQRERQTNTVKKLQKEQIASRACGSLPKK